MVYSEPMAPEGSTERSDSVTGRRGSVATGLRYHVSAYIAPEGGLRGRDYAILFRHHNNDGMESQASIATSTPGLNSHYSVLK